MNRTEIPRDNFQFISSALAAPELPAIEEYYNGSDPNIWMDEGSQFDHALLGQRQIFASQVDELRDLVVNYGIPDYPIIFCRLVNMLGCVYLEGDVRWPLIFLDSMKAKTPEVLRETFIHEAAHLASNGQDHDFVFAVTNNFLRKKAGLLASESDYDYRFCEADGLSIADIKGLSALCARLAMESSLSVQTIVELAMQVSVKMRCHRPVSPNEIETFFGKLLTHIHCR